MSIKENQRQKKLAKKKTKERSKRKQMVAEKNSLKSVPGLIRKAQGGAIKHCWISSDLIRGDGSGMGSMLFAREISAAQWALVVVLLDGDCLGVKDSFVRLCSPSDFGDYLDRARGPSKLVRCEPSVAKNYLDQLVDWASGFGMIPKGDFARIYPIFADIDGSASQQQYRFGIDGQPHFIQGPHDSPEFVRKVMSLLRANCEPGAYKFSLFMAEGQASILLPGDFEGPEWDDDMDDDQEADVIDSTAVRRIDAATTTPN
ncbi:hypothetical protein [Stieleria varia]|uniref:Uncharacterized protein n=1 Tax=Stieleria varia TaxID=2528005 RepID=A0A5C6B8I0_9BACT|nr:hypothetical protein [Stieleria varia]TWU08278.1 hypothetical protein Pla52n_08600 [Stieleria varia]